MPTTTMVRTSVSEFPNDNPLLHAGAVWILEEPCGSLVSVAYVEEAPADDTSVEDAPVAVDDGQIEPLSLELVDAVVESIADEEDDAQHDDDEVDGREAPAQTIEPPPPDPFDDFVQTLVCVAAAQGGACAAAALPDLLEGRVVPTHALDGEAIEALATAGYAVRVVDGVRASERLTTLVTAWTGVLRRTGDFSSCGSTMLHEWSAELVACSLGTPGRAQSLQYELRRRGVAAFGLVRVAA